MTTKTPYKKCIRRKRGFTMIEMAISATLMTLVGSVSYNSFVTQKPAMAMQQVAWQTMGELRVARSTAISKNTRATVKFSKKGMVIEADANGDGIITDAERRLADFKNQDVKMSFKNPGKQAFNSTGQFIENNRGGSPTSDTILLTHAGSKTTWSITILTNGQVSLKKA